MGGGRSRWAATRTVTRGRHARPALEKNPSFGGDAHNLPNLPGHLRPKEKICARSPPFGGVRRVKRFYFPPVALLRHFSAAQLLDTRSTPHLRPWRRKPRRSPSRLRSTSSCRLSSTRSTRTRRSSSASSSGAFRARVVSIARARRVGFVAAKSTAGAPLTRLFPGTDRAPDLARGRPG
jgi:hypothetical protein